MKRTITVGIVVLLAVLVGGGVWLYQRFFGNTTTASGPLSAIPLAQEPGASSPEALRFQIVQEKSEVRFTIPEVLRGQPNDVVGKSNQVAGEIAVDPNDLGTAKIGVIQVNARTLQTDDTRRNRAINNFILNTRTHEYITFTPTEIRGLSGKAEVGKLLTFQIAGNLTIRDVTKPVVFDVTAQADSATQLSGTATTTINRADYNLRIPNVPFVANVGEQVKLDIDFAAQAS
jgi:polyisoprenoid-binding protein YceI